LSAAAALHSVPAESTISSIRMQKRPFDVADDVHHFGFAGAFAALVDDRQRRVVEPLGQRARAHHAADVGRHDHQILAREARLDVGAHHRRGVEVVGRDIEKALDLPGVKVDRERRGRRPRW
jgi:hypothetical protein